MAFRRSVVLPVPVCPIDVDVVVAIGIVEHELALDPPPLLTDPTITPMPPLVWPSHYGVRRQAKTITRGGVGTTG